MGYLQCCGRKEPRAQDCHFLQDEGSLKWSPDQETKENCHVVSYLLPSNSLLAGHLLAKHNRKSEVMAPWMQSAQVRTTEQTAPRAAGEWGWGGKVV